MANGHLRVIALADCPSNTGDKLRSSNMLGFVCFIPLFGGLVPTQAAFDVFDGRQHATTYLNDLTFDHLDQYRALTVRRIDDQILAVIHVLMRLLYRSAGVCELAPIARDPRPERPRPWNS